ncbi:MAG: AmmeMemoRadiSam system radical SAM enzyme [Candidatus Gastranaerophilales bacterium]|nr:AmmeMemoRadiSam system radical SAM enzyme [Candidatus Gastranaerophilales bacterium]
MKYENSLTSNKVQCTLCPRNCTLGDGQRGFCYVRQNINGKIKLTTYGYTTGLAIDPVEKKPLYHFYPGSKVLSFGTIGCNLGCKFCQNYTTTKAKIDPTLLQKASPIEIATMAKKYGCKSVAFTYNDPVIFFEYAIDTAKECKKLGIKTIAVTAGYINPEPREKFFKYIDAVNIDLKAFSNDFYKRNSLVTFPPILDTIKYVNKKTNCHLELTTLIIEGENDSETELKNEFNWIKNELGENIPLHLSAFFPCYKFENHKPTSPQRLIKSYNFAKEAGLNYVYTGNLHHEKTSTTYCKNCKKELIIRNQYIIKSYNLDYDGKCKFCGTKCDGLF